MKKTNLNLYTKDVEIDEELGKASSIDLDWKVILASIGIVIAFAHLGVLIVRYIAAFMLLNRAIISNNVVYLIAMLLIPAGAWVLSTDTTFWNFRIRKRIALYVIVFNGIFTVLQPVYTLLWNLFVKLVFKIQITPAMTEGMVILLAQLLLFGCFAAIMAFIAWQAKEMLFSDEAKEKIGSFKIKYYVGKDKNSERGYYALFVKDLDTGRDVLISEDARLVHMLINGASGTGKTSSVITPQAEIDLTRKMKNRIARQMELLKMLISGQARIEKHWKGEFKERYIKPLPKYEKKYEEIYEEYPDCGMTFLAPNNALIQDIIELSNARGEKVKVLDPAKEYTEYKNVETCGLNPFYVPLGLSEEERAIYVISTATAFSQVLIAVNDIRDSSTDPYFVDINDSVSTNVAIAVMLAKNIEGKQANIIDVQQAIDDFTKLNYYVNTIEAHLNIHIEAPEIKKNNKNNAAVDYENMIHEFEAQGDNTDAVEKKKNSKDSPYAATILYIKQELLGAGREKMFDQARGIRNMVDKLLFDPRIKKILCADEAHRLDFDKMLLDNEITVVNTALEFGQATSTAFGLFFLLLQRVSILRRPQNNRSLHFLWIDEAPQYMHQVYDEMFTLYRQYKVAVSLAIQSLSQTEKNRKTSYLKNVFLSAGTHVVFGRLDTDEMKIYSELAGSKEVLMSQVTRAETSMLSDNPNVTMSERTTPTIKANIEGSDMRQMDFQEVVVITMEKGRPTEGIMGKVSFVSKSAFLPIERKEVDFSSFNPEADDEDEDIELSEARKQVKPKREQPALDHQEVIKPPETMERTMNQQFEDDGISLDDLQKFEREKINVEETKNIAAMLFVDD